MNKDISKTSATADLDKLSINTIRFLSIDAVQKANSGHPGLPMGAAAFAYVLWTRFLKHNPKNPKWFDRDRFILSAGHGSMLLYSLLYLTGYDLSLDQIKQFRQWDSITPGHPEYGMTGHKQSALFPDRLDANRSIRSATGKDDPHDFMLRLCQTAEEMIHRFIASHMSCRSCGIGMWR